MCTRPIKIKNPTKYITANNGQPYYIWIKCGKCTECKTEKQTEWTLRTVYQTIDCLSSGGWLYFDTLTYSNENLPRLTNFIDSNKNYACFNPEHIRNFYEKLRSYYNGKDTNIRYFITSEYGELRKRPHYHILLFVYDNTIELEGLSKNVSKAWQYGLTDGLPYKSRLYVKEHNYFEKLNHNVIRYVSKYVTKPQTFENIINERWKKIEYYLQNHEKHQYDKLTIKKIKANYMRHCNPFHRQSQHYGETALLHMNFHELIENNRLYYKNDNLKILKYCTLPTYFKRKLMQEQVKVNGKRMWINTRSGAALQQEREEKLLEKMTTRLSDIARTLGKKYTKEKLKETAYYMLFERGRFNGKNDYLDHHQEAIYFNYNTDKDLKYLGQKCISKNYAGNDKTGYEKKQIQPIEIENKVIIKSELETIIDDLQTNKDDILLQLKKEHMSEIRKIFFS